MNQIEQTCCFTGHRRIPSEMFPMLPWRLEKTVRQLIEEGIRFFGAGGAQGFDTLAAETVLRLREEFPHIRLILVLPCHNQTRGWPPAAVARYDSILRQADKVVYASENYTPSCMHKRNRYLVDNSAVCVAYCARATGGTAYTVNYARRLGRKVLFCGRRWDDYTLDEMEEFLRDALEEETARKNAANGKT